MTRPTVAAYTLAIVSTVICIGLMIALAVYHPVTIYQMRTVPTVYPLSTLASAASALLSSLLALWLDKRQGRKEELEAALCRI